MKFYMTAGNATSASSQLKKLDDRPVMSQSGQMLCFTGIRNEVIRLPYFLEYHRQLGVDRFFIMDNGSDDGTREFVLSQPDCHCFHTEGSHFECNIWPPNWTNTLLNVYGDRHWCVVVDADELLVYPESEHVSLRHFCRFLESTDADAFIASMIDMYGEGPIAKATYEQGRPFLETAAFFDPKPGWIGPNDGGYPPDKMFGGVRERVFWHGRFKKTLPPCLTKVPLVKWKREMSYLVAQHEINRAKFSSLRGALLHFKFLTGFREKSAVHVEENVGLDEKSLEERVAYIEALARDPDLTLKNANSVRYTDSRQLTALGWLATSPAFEEFVAKLRK